MDQKAKYLVIAFLAACFLLMPLVSFQQDVIRLKDGREIKVQILWKNNDTLAYSKYNSTYIEYKIRISDIDTIYPLSGPKPQESCAMIKRKYLIGNKVKNAGLGILAGGVAICAGGALAGIIGLSKNGFENNGKPAVNAMIVGGTISITGIIIATIGGSIKSSNKRKLERFSVELRPTSDATLIMVTLRF